MKGESTGYPDPALFADDPDWASCVPEMMSGGRKCGMPDHEDCSPLDVESVACPLLVPLAEEGIKSWNILNGVLDIYLGKYLR